MRRMDMPTPTEIEYFSSADRTMQPAMWLAPSGAAPAPLLVALHEWSADFRSKQCRQYAEPCRARGWAMIFPNFRGPSERPEACGSEWVVQDILSAVDFARGGGGIDERRIHLVGVSGGGHASLLMAGRAPSVWAGVSAWAGISDLAAWHAESLHRGNRYAGMIERSCGGLPGGGTPAGEQCRLRSPLTWLAAAARLSVDINAGIHDGHTGSVPISHSLRAFNVLAAPQDRFRDEQIAEMVQTRQVPAGLRFQGVDELYGPKRVLLRRQSGRARVTIFEGGHEIIVPAALEWLGRQER